MNAGMNAREQSKALLKAADRILAQAGFDRNGRRKRHKNSSKRSR